MIKIKTPKGLREVKDVGELQKGDIFQVHDCGVINTMVATEKPRKVRSKITGKMVWHIKADFFYEKGGTNG